MMKKIDYDWNAEAAAAADKISERFIEAHRGAVPWMPGVVAIFGNDSYDQDLRTKDEVVNLRLRLDAEGVRELGFGVDAESGYTWVLLVADDGPRRTGVGAKFQLHLLTGTFNDYVWDAWRATISENEKVVDASFEQIQRRIADSTLDEGQ